MAFYLIDTVTSLGPIPTVGIKAQIVREHLVSTEYSRVLVTKLIMVRLFGMKFSLRSLLLRFRNQQQRMRVRWHIPSEGPGAYCGRALKLALLGWLRVLGPVVRRATL